MPTIDFGNVVNIVYFEKIGWKYLSLPLFIRLEGYLMLDDKEYGLLVYIFRIILIIQ